MVVLKITILKECYWGLNIVEKGSKLNNKLRFHHKILTIFADNIGLKNY